MHGLKWPVNCTGMKWHTLCVHRNDTALAAECRMWTWPVPFKAQKPFGHFRILQTGRTANQRHLLACSGFEMYGRLLTPHTVCTVAYGLFPYNR